MVKLLESVRGWFSGSYFQYQNCSMHSPSFTGDSARTRKRKITALVH